MASARALGVVLVLTLANGARASEAEERIYQIGRTLTPALAAVLRPAPPVRSRRMEDKLAFMAELGRRVDQRERHSDSRAWRKIMHWPEPGDTLFTFDRSAPDTSPLRYPALGAREDPALDFAASVALAWLDARHFSCDFPLRARYLAEHGLMPPGPSRFEAGKCQAFERWAEVDRVEAVEVVYVTPSWADPSASMGHVIFRIRHSGSERVTGQSFEPVFAFAATDDPETTSWYLVKGLTGGLTTTLKVEPMGAVYRRYGIAEARDLVLYELKLSPKELRYLLGEVYAQATKKVAIPYAFLSVNCASLAYDFVQSVLPELPDRAATLAHPHEVVSLLLAAGRATPRAILPSRHTRAAVAEGRLDELIEKMPRGERSIPGLDRLHAVRTGDVAAREQALKAVHAAIEERAFEPELAHALAAYVDALIDVETWAIDVRLGKYDPAATSPALDEALDLRASLPMLEDERFLPFPERRITPSGSRRREVRLGLAGERPIARLTLAVLDEATGEPRRVLLRQGGRMTVLRSETAIAWADEVVLEEERVVIFDTGTWSLGPETELGWWSSRLGFHFAAETLSRPQDDLDFALRVRGGLGLTLAASADFADHLVLGLSLEGSAWSHGAADVRLSAGPFVEIGIALGDQRLRVMGRALPGWAFPAGFGWAVESSASLDLVLDGDFGLLLRPTFALRWDMPIADAWEAGVGLSW